MIDVGSMTIDELKQVAGLARGLVGCGKRSSQKIEEKRVVLVVDRGWIFAGDQSITSDGYIKLAKAVHVFRWESIGFAKMLEQWQDSKVDLRNVADVEVPKDSVIFRVGVAADWGLK